jgi:hypothetical protein
VLLLRWSPPNLLRTPLAVIVPLDLSTDDRVGDSEVHQDLVQPVLEAALTGVGPRPRSMPSLAVNINLSRSVATRSTRCQLPSVAGTCSST